MSSNLVQIIKRAAVEAVDAAKPVTFHLGTVQSISPLKVSVGQKLQLGQKQLIKLKGITLQKGETVALIQTQGGQTWLILGGIA